MASCQPITSPGSTAVLTSSLNYPQKTEASCLSFFKSCSVKYRCLCGQPWVDDSLALQPLLLPPLPQVMKALLQLSRKRPWLCPSGTAGWEPTPEGAGGV